MNDISLKPMKMPVSERGVLTPRTLEEITAYVKMVVKSELTPKSFRERSKKNGKTVYGAPNLSAMIVAIQMGAEIGLAPMASLRYICVINGVPCIWGDGLLAMVRAHPACEHIYEDNPADVAEMKAATCRCKRRGEPERIVTFTWAMAAKAKLTTKPGPWQDYPERMLMMRARAWVLRDTFADALAGLAVVEEVRDYASTEPAEDIVKDALAPGLHSMKPPRQPQIEIEPAKPAPASIEEAIEAATDGPAEQPTDETDWSLVGPPPMGEENGDAEIR